MMKQDIPFPVNKITVDTGVLDFHRLEVI